MEEEKNWGGRRQGAGRPRGIKKPYKVISACVPVEYADKLKQAAEKAGVSISKFIQMAIDKELEK